MREILFRGKRIDTGEWIEGFYYRRPNPITKDGLPMYHGIADLTSFGAEVIPESVSEFTGLCDKNGKRIFEGDIVRQDYSKTINARFDPDTLGFIDADNIEGHHI